MNGSFGGHDGGHGSVGNMAIIGNPNDMFCDSSLYEDEKSTKLYAKLNITTNVNTVQTDRDSPKIGSSTNKNTNNNLSSNRNTNNTTNGNSSYRLGCTANFNNNQKDSLPDYLNMRNINKSNQVASGAGARGGGSGGVCGTVSQPGAGVTGVAGVAGVGVSFVQVLVLMKEKQYQLLILIVKLQLIHKQNSNYNKFKSNRCK